MGKTKKIVIALCAVAAVGAVAAVVANRDTIFKEKVDVDFTVDTSNIKTGTVNARVAVHDPSVYKENGKYYIFGTHMTAAVSDDLRTWTYLGNGYTEKNAIYGDLMADKDNHVFYYTGNDSSVIPTDGNGGVRLWAPDVIYNKAMKKYCLYYCTSSTFNASTLEFATSDTIDGKYEWAANLIYSGLTNESLTKTDVLDYVSEDYAKENYIDIGGEYNFNEYPNALDPTVFYDKDGKLWMVYGSWSGGIFLLQLDEQTGKVIHPEADPENQVDAYFGKRLLGGGHKSIEGPYIMYDKDSDYYYLFVSYGGLNTNGGYQIRVFRSKNVDGDYVDMNGQTPYEKSGNHACFGLKLSGNYFMPSLKADYMATGHNSAFIDPDTNLRYVVYHTRFSNNGENFSDRVKQYILNEEGWPCVLPYNTNGEVPSNDIKKDDVVGTYYVDNLGMNIDKNVAEPFKLVLTKRGNVFGENIEGKWTMKNGTYYMTISYEDVTYSGVFCKMTDEAGTDVMAFSAVGNNTTLWGAKYDE